MPWVKLDDGFADHPKIRTAGPLALVAQVRALCYAARFLTNGRIPADVVKTIFADLTPLTPRVMVTEKLWHLRNQTYFIHDYLMYNPTRKFVLEQRRKKAEAGRLGGLAKGQADAKAPATPFRTNLAVPPSPPLKTTTSKKAHAPNSNRSGHVKQHLEDFISDIQDRHPELGK